ncbi:MAG: UDP-glucose/GDP-mannose dehydrogenase family protein [Candidatus Sungbacteria bacterium]|nr:UDP-glucose/GDP-mannose dehydrogenase family protein [Candidatus Sungbacteria bacterium]
MNMKQKIGIVGIGMVGAPLARYFREIGGYARGKDLFLFDIDRAKRCSDDAGKADVIFLCVPTPRRAGGSADLSHLENAIDRVSVPVADRPGERKIIVIKSTVPPGTTEYFQKRFPQHDFLFNPEFLTERRAWENTIRPDRQLVGWTAQSKKYAATVLALLPTAPLTASSPELELTATEAELVKYAANVFLARKVTFANAIFDLANHHGVNYEHIRKGIASDPRIGSSHLDVFHGGYRGYGGYCFIKDTDALVAHARELGLDHVADLIGADVAFNTGVLAIQGLTPQDVAVHDHTYSSVIPAEAGIQHDQQQLDSRSSLE